MNLDWIAGFFDGEGSISLKLNRKATIVGYRIFPRVLFTQKNRGVLESIRKFLSMGHIRKRTGMGISRATIYELEIDNFGECRRFITMLKDKVQLKRRQLQTVDKWYKIHDYYKKPDPARLKDELLLFIKLRRLNGQWKRIRIRTKEVESLLNDFDEKMRKIRQQKLDEADTLRRLYWDRNLSQREIANQLEMDKSTVALKMRRYKIPIRSFSLAISLRDSRRRHSSRPNLNEDANQIRDSIASSANL